MIAAGRAQPPTPSPRGSPPRVPLRRGGSSRACRGCRFAAALDSNVAIGVDAKPAAKMLLDIAVLQDLDELGE